MTENQRKRFRLLENIALLACLAVLFTILLGNASRINSTATKTVHLAADTNGIPHLYGIPLANPFLRRNVLSVIALFGAEVEFAPQKGWMKNPISSNNVWLASEDINRAGLSPGAKAIKQIEGENRLSRSQPPTNASTELNF